MSLLQFLANRTLSTEASLLAESLAWVRAHAPDPPDFLVGWPDIILGLLTGTGLVTDADGTGELQWVHRSFAEYLAARDAAEALPSTWPGTDPHADALLREALEGVGQDQSALTLACWAEHRDTAVARLLDFLIVWSDAYEVLLKHHGGGGVTVNDDSSRVDQYIALAGRLLAEGVPVPAAMSGQILDRLLIRARSIFNARYFCQLVAAQPQRERARNALMRMAHDNDLSGVIRADAALTVGRIFGLDVLHDATEPLLALDGSESFLYEEGAGWRPWASRMSGRSSPTRFRRSVMRPVPSPTHSLIAWCWRRTTAGVASWRRRLPSRSATRTGPPHLSLLCPRGLTATSLARSPSYFAPDGRTWRRGR